MTNPSSSSSQTEGPSSPGGGEEGWPIRRPCAAANYSKQAPDLGYLKVPFALCNDGIARHVTAIEHRDQGPFHCLDCEEILTLRMPRNARNHFAHRAKSQCKGETALHKYAKALFEREKALTLPPLIIEHKGHRRTASKPRLEIFDEVIVEQRLKNDDERQFQPDAIGLRKTASGAQTLAVEFHVFNAVDDAKLDKIRQRDLSTIEVDLFYLDPGMMTASELDREILHEAPRLWLHHRGERQATENYAAKVEEDLKAKAERLRGCIMRPARKGAVPADWTTDAFEDVEYAGLTQLLGLEVDGDHWFTVTSHLWQAEVLSSLVIRPCTTYHPGQPHKVSGTTSQGGLNGCLPDFMIRGDLGSYNHLTRSAGISREEYGSPHGAIFNYLAKLSVEAPGKAVYWDRANQSFFIEKDLHELIYRRIEFPRRIESILRKSHPNAWEGKYDDWSASYRFKGLTPVEIIETGGPIYNEFAARILSLERMSFYGSDHIEDDLCGLPLEGVRQQIIDRIAEEKAAAQEKLRLEAQRRRTSLEQLARDDLRDEADAWLQAEHSNSGQTRLEYAELSPGSLYEMKELLANAREARILRKRSQALKEKLQEQLISVAEATFQSKDLARLFLNTGHTSLGGRKPIDYCESENALAHIKGLMTRKR
ncbi:DUF2384 domain-containing protein [Croceicoccus gelatinilyticus]|uniref:competence protein CoiA family protein n=1 Tax=Croceicoccus gelatinilyticus TaxID=2835536 RepID=UPI001BCC68A8|nr:DUF2384 domain-containing protein [Croceicoccus gelatinilyticus]MBS7671785.1 DUF2384 domain-containing protein [Croceicoccus gelatinilyticus]